jgi:hypothetical protein
MISTEFIKSIKTDAVSPKDNKSEWDCPPTVGIVGELDVDGNRDLGDLRTWALIALMCSVAAIIAIIAYFLPHGQDAGVPPIRVY